MKVLIVLFSILVTVVAMLYFGGSGDVLLTTTQPDSVTYDAKYELQIKEGSRELQLFDFARGAEIMIARQGNDFSYGHGIDIDVLGSDVSKTQVEWIKSGINLHFDSGHNLFIPKNAFEGGR